MEEEERYEIHIYDDCVDLYDNGVFDKSISDSWELEKLLNQQDKEIKQLKEQLHDLPKKIVGEIVTKINQDMTIAEDYWQIRNILDTILKKFGGENE